MWQTTVIPRERSLLRSLFSVDHGGDPDTGSVANSADIEMSADELDEVDQRGDTEVSLPWGDTKVSLPVPPSSLEEEDDFDDFTLVSTKRRKRNMPVSPSAAEPSRAQR